jgi:formamidopyrimidine-DNA glycosylase
MEQYLNCIKDVGEDYLNIEYNFFKNKITAQRLKNIELFEFLTSQKWISGLDSDLVNEILSNVKIDTNRILGTLSKLEIVNLYNSIINVLNNIYKLGGICRKNSLYLDNSLGGYEITISKNK